MRSLFGSLTITAIICCCLLFACSDRDNPTKYNPSTPTFWRTYDFGDYAAFMAVAQDGGGGIMVGGYSEVQVIDSSGPTPVIDTASGALLVKCRPNGDTVWTVVTRNERQFESVRLLTPDFSGGYMAVFGRSYRGGPGSDFVVQQVGGDGVLGPSIAVNQNQYDDVYDVRKSSDGNFMLVGRQGNMVGPARDKAYVAKINQSGDMIWQRTFANSGANLRAERVLELPDRTLVTAGYANPADGSGFDLHVLRLSATGDSLHGVIVPFEGETHVKDIAALPGGGYKILLFQGQDPSVCSIVRMDDLGTVTSIQHSFGSTRLYIEDGKFTPDGGAIFCGCVGPDYFDHSALLVKLDASGVIVWEREFDDPDASVEFRSIIDYSEGGYVLAGFRQLLLGGSYEGLLVHCDENGRVPEAP